tara:strand:+ start:1694 stop:1945 length:252 start_codon:yes stop_codon:yes gene_type:complete
MPPKNSKKIEQKITNNLMNIDASVCKVRITANNVWASSCKFYREDIVTLPASEADLLVGAGAAQETKDDVTVAISSDGNRVDV